MFARKLRALGVAGVLFATLLSGLGANRIIVYSGQNPTSAQANQSPRFQRLGDGTFMRDVMGALATSGAYSNLKIIPGTGLFVTVNPQNASQLGALYQMASDDPNPIPTSAPNLPADNTQIIVQATQAANSSAIGPLAAPGGGGNAVYYLLEAQLSTIDGNQQSLLFVNSSGTTQYNNVNTWRSDVITYQTKAGTASTADCSSTFPTPPSVDSGWVSIGLVCVPNGLTQIVTGDISMTTTTKFSSVFNVTGSAPVVVTSNNVTCPTCFTTANTQALAGLGVSSPLCTDSGSLLTTTGCAIPIKQGSLGTSNVLCSNASSGNIDECINSNWPFNTGGTAITVQVVPAGCAAGAICTCRPSPSGGETPCDSDNYLSISPHTGCHATNATVNAAQPDFGLLVSTVNETGGSNTGVHILWYNATGSAIAGNTDIGVYVICLSG